MLFLTGVHYRASNRLRRLSRIQSGPRRRRIGRKAYAGGGRFAKRLPETDRADDKTILPGIGKHLVAELDSK
jgi:hypothetical protein